LTGARLHAASWMLALCAASCASCPTRVRANDSRDAQRSIFVINVPIDASVIGASAALAFVPLAFGDSIVTPSCPCNPHSVNAIDRGVIGNSSRTAATLSDVTAISAVAAPVGFALATLGPSTPFLQDAIVFGETVLVSNALANVTKLAVQRPRPELYATRDPALLKSTDGYLSFYSGHTTITFAALSATSMILNLRHGTTVWPWVATLLIGSSVAAERVLAGKHFVSDVTVGAIAGTAEGIVIPYLHVRRPAGATGSVSLLPIPQGAELVWSGAL
jgi:membrane-associated phospholipid phosphatase